MQRTLIVALVALSILPGVAGAATKRHDNFPLHPGSRGPRVAALQWLLSGHRPNVYTKVKPTLKRYTPGIYGSRTKAAVLAYKFRLGFPRKGECGEKTTYLIPTVTPYFFNLLEGKVHRSICWVALAQQRVRLVVPGVSKMALAIKQLEVAQIGTHEVPDGSNRGPRISYTSNGYGPYQGSTGAYGLAWCASFQNWAFGAKGPGYFANRSALVSYIESWAAHRGYVSAKAKVGDLVAFLDDGGHMGFVARVTAAGYSSIEGNSSNSVREVWHPWNYRLRVFIAIPGVS